MVAIAGLPGESLTRAISLIRETVPGAMDTMRLGGGTALAALWNHRTSTDIDLACGEITFNVLRADGSPLLAALLRLRSEGQIPRPRFAARMIAWEYRDTGEVSIVRRLGEGEELLSGETDDLTGVPIVAPGTILHAKLAGRVAGSARLLVRDGYDLPWNKRQKGARDRGVCSMDRSVWLGRRRTRRKATAKCRAGFGALACAYHYDPDAIAWATEHMDDGQRKTVESMMRSVLASPRRITEGRPLMDCRHRMVARDPWRAFAAMYLRRSGVEEFFPSRRQTR